VDPLTLRYRELLAERYKPVPPHRVITWALPMTPEQAAGNWADLQQAVSEMDTDSDRT
jgi:hypothetical protein